MLVPGRGLKGTPRPVPAVLTAQTPVPALGQLRGNPTATCSHLHPHSLVSSGYPPLLLKLHETLGTWGGGSGQGEQA